MALRPLNRAKTWAWAWGCGHHQLVKAKSGFVGTISSNKFIDGHNFLFDSRCLPIPLNQSCRHYYLPPPPSGEGMDDVEFRGGVFAVKNLERALPSAQFAVMMHNETEGRNIRLERVVRASRLVDCDYVYYLTLEGIDENGDLNVYYAEVFDCRDKEMKQLKKWQLVDESFSYPKWETRPSKVIVEKIRRGIEGNRNHVLRPWLPGMTLRYFEHEFGAEVVPVCNMMDYRRVVYYALSALEMHNKTKGKEICLKEVLHASRKYFDGKVFYILFLKGVNDKKYFNFFYAILEVSKCKEELIKWHVVDEVFSGPLEKNQIAVGA